MEDALHIATHMRQDDRRECEALTGAPPELILPQSIQQPGTITWEVEGEPVAMGGITPSIPKVGVVWMTSTDAILKHKTKFLRLGHPFVSEIHKDYPILTNMVDARNALHIRWLKWLGFSFLRKVDKWGAQSVPFYEFARYERQCA